MYNGVVFRLCLKNMRQFTVILEEFMLPTILINAFPYLCKAFLRNFQAVLTQSYFFNFTNTIKEEGE